jgi:glycosyltransferase involved in cell wall biosynthesis
MVSVVMPVYNGEKYLKEAVESILCQTFHDFEFLIMNDGSTDATSSILSHYQETDNRIQVYNQENQGLITTLNTGCALAKRKYIARMDADDIAFPDRLERQIDFLERNPHVGLLGGTVVRIDSSGRFLDTVRSPEHDHELQKGLLKDNYFFHPSVMFQKQAFHEARGYRKAFRHCEDYDLWLRIAERYALGSLQEPVLYYRLHPNQISLCHINQQTLSLLGSQVAAEIRRETGHDPMESVELLTSEALINLGVNPETIQRAFHQSYVGWAILHLLLDEEKTASEFINAALACSCSKRFQRHRVAMFHWTYAKTYYKQGKLNQSVFSMLRAWRMQPTLVGRFIWKAFSKLMRSPRTYSEHR